MGQPQMGKDMVKRLWSSHEVLRACRPRRNWLAACASGPRGLTQRLQAAMNLSAGTKKSVFFLSRVRQKSLGYNWCFLLVSLLHIKGLPWIVLSLTRKGSSSDHYSSLAFNTNVGPLFHFSGGPGMLPGRRKGAIF